MNDDLVGLLLGGFVACILGFAGLRSLLEGLRNNSKHKYPPIYNNFGIITGGLIILWVILMFFVMGYLWTQWKVP